MTKAARSTPSEPGWAPAQLHLPSAAHKPAGGTARASQASLRCTGLARDMLAFPGSTTQSLHYTLFRPLPPSKEEEGGKVGLPGLQGPYLQKLQSLLAAPREQGRRPIAKEREHRTTQCLAEFSAPRSFLVSKTVITHFFPMH